MTPLQRFLSLLSQDKRDIFYMYTYAVLNGIINLSLPVGIQAILGLVLAGRLSSSWVILTVIVMLGVAIAGLFQIMQLYIVEVLQQRLFTRAAFDFAYRIPKFRLLKLSNYYPPELINRFFDTVVIQKSLSKILMDFSTSILQIFFGLILLSLYHPIFIAFGLVLIIIIFFIVYFTSKNGLKTSIAESNHKYELVHWLTELARAIKTFKLSGDSELNLQKTNGIVERYIGARKLHFRILLRQYSGIIGLKTLVTAGLLIVGALLLIQNAITIGQFVASEIVIILVLNSSEKLIMSMEAIYDVLTSIEKLGKITDLELEQDTEDNMAITKQGAIKVQTEELIIKGSREGETIVNNLNLEIQPGEKICISGKNGTGKSSLLKVLSTSMDNYKGSILYNDIPIQNLNLNDLRKRMGVVFDDQEIFFGTYAENISLGRKNITDEDIISLTKDVGLDDLITSLPDGYKQVIINPERTFSGTDRVRLLIARALAGNPNLLLAEDLFSSLQADCKDSLLKMLFSRCSTETTLIIISNNKEIQAKCDRVIELKG
jgi:ABC-type bacteriocin/lantibiotic exporter with double-glycine peptidase domain